MQGFTSIDQRRANAETYYHIRQCDLKRDIRGIKQGLASLSSPHARRCVKQLLKHETFPFAFDKILVSPGLRVDMRISVIHKLINGRFDEEALRYLGNIEQIWSNIFCHIHNGMQRLDYQTVKALELRSPRLSTLDADEIQAKARTGLIFGNFSKEEREIIWIEVQKTDMIPSLFSFFEDLKFFHSCADGIKHIVKLDNEHPTIYQSLNRDFKTPCTVVELGPLQYEPYSVPDELPFTWAYHQIWICAMRNFRCMAQSPTKHKRDLLARVPFEGADERTIYELAVLATTLGFHSEKLEILNRQSPDVGIAHAALCKARKPDQYRYENGILEQCVAEFEATCNSATMLQSGKQIVSMSSDESYQPGKKCGFPSLEDFERDRPMFYLRNILESPCCPGKTITSFFVRCHVYRTFLGDILGDHPLRCPQPGLQEQLLELQEQFGSQRSTNHEQSLEPEPEIANQQSAHQVWPRELRPQILQNSIKRASNDIASSFKKRRVTVEAILFIKLEEGQWKCAHRETIQDKPFNIEEAAKMMLNNGYSLFSYRLDSITPQQCFASAMQTSTHAIFLLPERNIQITEDLRNSASEISRGRGIEEIEMTESDDTSSIL